MGSWDTVVINGYSAIKEELEKRGDAFSSRPSFLISRLVMKNGEDSLGLEKFKPAYILHRKLVAGALRVITNTKLEDTHEIIFEEGDKMLEEFLSWNNRSKRIDSVVHVSVARIIYRIFYARQQNIGKEQFARFLDIHNETAKFAMNGNLMDLMPWLRSFMPSEVRNLLKLLNREESVVQNIVEEHVTKKLRF